MDNISPDVAIVILAGKESNANFAKMNAKSPTAAVMANVLMASVSAFPALLARIVIKVSLHYFFLPRRLDLFLICLFIFLNSFVIQNI